MSKAYQYSPLFILHNTSNRHFLNMAQLKSAPTSTIFCDIWVVWLHFIATLTLFVAFGLLGLKNEGFV
jgi:hypothetical protein